MTRRTLEVELRIDALDRNISPVPGFGWVVAIDGFRLCAGVERTEKQAEMAAHEAAAEMIKRMAPRAVPCLGA